MSPNYGLNSFHQTNLTKSKAFYAFTYLNLLRRQYAFNNDNDDDYHVNKNV